MYKRVLIFVFVCIFLIAGCAQTAETPPPGPEPPGAAPTAAASVPPSPTAYEAKPWPAAYTGPGSWQLLDQMGGTAKALLREGNTLYIGVGLHVFILGAEDPKDIKVLGKSPLLPQFAESITGDGKGRLFVSCGSGGLVIIDVSDPSSPAISGRLDTLGFTEGAALTGKYAVIADGPQGLQVADVSDVKNPVIVSEAYPLAYAYGVVLKDNMAYAAAGGSGLLAVDMSDPEAPQEKGMIKLGGFQYGVEISGNSLYTAGAWGGISVLDLSKPLEPAVTDTIPTSGWAMALSAQGSGLLVMDGADGAMLYDISGGKPSLKSAFNMGGFIEAGVLAGGGAAFLLDKEKGFMTVDFIDKNGPRLLSRWMPILDGRRVTISGSTGYVSGGLSGMHLIDLRDRSSISEAYWYDTGGGYANKVVADGDTACLSTHLDTDFPMVIFDVSDPYKPVRLGAVPNDEALFNSAFRSMTPGDGYIYIAGEWATMSVDVSDPRNPKLACRDNSIMPVNAASCGDLLVTTESYRITLIDVSDPENMRMLSELPKNTTGEAVAFIDPATVITSADPGIWIVDVSDPANPRKQAELAVSGSVMDISVDGTDAYLSTLGNGVQIVDISDRLKPVLKDSVDTLGVAYDCCVKGDLMLVADSFAGLTIYQYMPEGEAADAFPAAAGTYDLPLLLSENVSFEVTAPPEHEPDSGNKDGAAQVVVTSAADNGPGTLRDALEKLQPNTLITFDTNVFPAGKPAVIELESSLPEIVSDYITIDASNAGVILEGSKLADCNGLLIYSSHNKVMGLQIMHFPLDGIHAEGQENQIGGNRSIGSGPVGQGNLASGNGLYGIHVNGYNQLVTGNLVGVDVKGATAVPNYDGIFIGGDYVTVGGTGSGEGNVSSGNQSINIDTWGDHTRIIGNIFGLDITGKMKVKGGNGDNLVMESGAMNTIVGGTTPAERNIISGGFIGVVFSDPNSYQNSVTGNYIGTDITGAKAIPNQNGVLLWTSGNHRVGGTGKGEGNLISGNKTGVELSGYGVADNIILGNRIGVDASGRKPLPNSTGISVYMGQRHAVIGGYTPEEGNIISGGDFSMRISNRGIADNYISGNSVSGASVAGVFFEDHASNNFVQGNTFGGMKGNSVRVDYGAGNGIRSNVFTGKPGEMILLAGGGNGELPAPIIEYAGAGSVSGEACPFGRVEVYIFEKSQAISLGFARADESGSFTFQSSQSLAGKKIIMLATDVSGNTSAFSKMYTAK